MKRITIALLMATSIVILLPLLSPKTSELSTNPCSPCHRGYYQYLDILEDPSNKMPATLNVNETKTVSIIIQNSVNTERYSIMSSVTVTLSSSYGHFSINSPTVYLGDLPEGKKTATWQIIGTSDGFDYLLISASAYNTHKSDFQDSYTPIPLVTVGNATGTPPPPASPEPYTPPPSTANSTPTPTPSQNSTTSPPATDTPNPSEPPAPAPQPSQDLSIILSSPAENEEWLPETQHTIEWITSGGTGPIEITIEYRKEGIQQWTSLAAAIPDNKSITWTIPNLAASYDVQVTAVDSANPPQTASTIRGFEVAQAQANSELPVIPITTAAIGVAAGGAVLSVRKKILNGQKKAEKTTISKPENVPREDER